MTERGGGKSRGVGRPRAGQEPLTREGILGTALRIVDEEGMGALSMRRLAAELGVNPMSIYHHLPGKGAVISGLVGMVFSRMRVSAPESSGWRERVRAYARAHRGVVRAHPNLALQIVSDPAAVSEAVLLGSEPLYAALEDAGLSPAQIVQAADTLVDFIHGFELGEASNPSGEFDIGPDLTARLKTLPPGEAPALRRVFGALAETGTAYDFDAGFEAGLALLLKGIEAAVDETARRGLGQQPRAES